MEIYFVALWVLSLLMIVLGLINLAIGITYKNWKRIAIAIISIGLAIVFYYLPYYIVINDSIKAIKHSLHR